MRHLIIYAFAFMLTMPLTAQSSIYWAKKGNGLWHVANNWMVPGGTPQNRVPNAMDTVYIQHDSVIIANGVNAFARRIELGVVDSAGTGLAILDGGSLSVDDMGAVKIDIEGGIKMINSSLLNIGHLSISHCTPGIEARSNCHIENRGTLAIDSVIQYGVSTVSKIVNNSTGTLSINRVSSGNQGLPHAISTDSLINHGEILINNSGRGINSSYLENTGSMYIDSCFENGVQADLFTNSGDFHGSYCDYGFFALRIENAEVIKVKNCLLGIYCDELENYDSVMIINCETGIQVFDEMLNESGGRIHINNQYSPFTGLYVFSSATATNYGKITIDSIGGNSKYAIINSNICNNYGQIFIADCLNGIDNRSSLSNIGGLIQINASNRGIWNSSNIVNENNGTIEILSPGEGLRSFSGGSIDNRATASFRIFGDANSYLEILTGSTLTNNGILEIGN